MTSAQEWLKKQRRGGAIVSFDRNTLLRLLFTSELEGDLDLSDYSENLRKINFQINKITSINLEKCQKLTHIEISANKIKSSLEIFSHLVHLEKLDIGVTSTSRGKGKEIKYSSKYDTFYVSSELPEIDNDFFGSLKSLENCKKLSYLCIGRQVNIKGGLEYLPTRNQPGKNS